MTAAPIDLGTFVEGEIPPPLVVTFQDEDGLPLDLSAFEAGWFHMQRFGADAVQRPADISPSASDATKGQATYTWVTGDMVAGSWLGQMWAIDTTRNHYCSVTLVWFVQPAITVPA